MTAAAKLWTELAVSPMGALCRAGLQGAIALGIVWVLVRLWPAMPARVRPWLWRLACLRLIVGLCALPILAVPLLPSTPASWDRPAQYRPAPFAYVPDRPSQSRIQLTPAVMPADVHASAPRPVGANPSALLLIAWSIVVCFAGIRIAASWRRIAGIRHDSSPIGDPVPHEILGSLCAKMGLRRVPDLREAHISTPLLTGFLRPAILVPRGVAETTTPAEWKWIFAHELAHIRRGDIPWGWLYLVISGLFFFDPLVWLTRREWFLAQEIACDAEAVRLTQLPKTDYARLLVAIAARRDPGGLPALGVMDAYRTLERRLTMLTYLRNGSRLRNVAAGLVLGTAALLCLTPWTVTAQTAISADPNVRLAQQWEDVLLLEATDYLGLAPRQYKEMQSLSDYARSRTDEVDRQRAILKKMVQEQHEALLQGRHPTASDQMLALQKEKSIKEMEERISEEIVNRLTPRLTALLNRRQIARAWQLVRGRAPQGEASRVALYDPESGFVLGEGEVDSLLEELVRADLRRAYSDDVLNDALQQPAALSFVRMMGGQAQRSAISFIYRVTQTPDHVVMDGPGSAEAVLDVTSSDEEAPPTPPRPEVPQPVRDAINKEAEQIRAGLDKDPDAYLKRAPADVLIGAMRHLTKRMFLSPRIKEALEERAHRSGL